MWWLFVLALKFILSVILLLISAYGAYWVYFSKYNYWQGKPVRKAFCLPLIGNAWGVLFRKSIPQIDEELYKKYGRLFGTYSTNIPTLYVADPELLKLIFVKDFNHFNMRREFKMGNPLMDNNLSVLKGDDHWRNIRNTMTPAFSTGKLKKMIPLIRDCAQLTVDNFEKYSADGSPVDFKSLLGCYTLDVIANVAFGTKIDSHNDPDNIFIYHAKQLFSMELNWKALIAVLLPKVSKLFGATIFPDSALEFFRHTVESIVERRKENREVRHDFLQLMIDSMEDTADSQKDSTDTEKPETSSSAENPVDSVENIKRKPLTNDEFLAQTIMFFLAAYDTTGSALTATCYFLALNPECQRKAAQETDRIWRNYNVIDADALHEAKYLGAVIDEALRLCPPGGRIERTCVRDYRLPNTGLVITKGTLVAIPVTAIHTDPQFYPEPQKFKPERFLDEERNNRNPYTYLPFGAGPRNCIAVRLALLEVKLCLIYLLRHFEFSPSVKTTIPLQFRNSILIHIKGVILHVTKRSH